VVNEIIFGQSAMMSISQTGINKQKQMYRNNSHAHSVVHCKSGG